MTRTTVTKLLLAICIITGAAMFASCSSENEPLNPSVEPDK